MNSTIKFRFSRFGQLTFMLCLLLIGLAFRPLTAQNLTVEKGKLCLSNGKDQDCVLLSNTVSVLFRDQKGLHLETIRSNVKPDFKAIAKSPHIQALPLKNVSFSLEKDVVRWQASKGKIPIKGESPLGLNERLIVHGDGDLNTIFVVPECLPTSIRVRPDGFEIRDQSFGKGVYLGLSPGETGNRVVLACSGVGVAVDILDNIDDPSFDYARWANEHSGADGSGDERFPYPGSLRDRNQVDPESLQAWRDGFCAEFEWSMNLVEVSGLVYCTLNAKEDKLLLDCEGDLIVVRDGRWHRIPLDTCPVGLLLTGPDEVQIIAESESCLASLGCL